MIITAYWFILMCMMPWLDKEIPFNDVERDKNIQLEWTAWYDGWWNADFILYEKHSSDYTSIKWTCSWEASPNLLCQEARNTSTFELHTSDCIETQDLWYNALRCKADYIWLWKANRVTCLHR